MTEREKQQKKYQENSAEFLPSFQSPPIKNLTRHRVFPITLRASNPPDLRQENTVISLTINVLEAYEDSLLPSNEESISILLTVRILLAEGHGGYLSGTFLTTQYDAETDLLLEKRFIITIVLSLKVHPLYVMADKRMFRAHAFAFTTFSISFVIRNEKLCNSRRFRYC